MSGARPAPEILEFYRRHGVMTHPGACAPLFDALGGSVDDLADALHGLLLHEHIAPQYGVTLTDDRRREVHIRRADERLALIAARDERPLGEPRPAAERSVANCRHYSVLMASMLRERGVPARARCGFGAYFEPGQFIDHWVAEYWDQGRGRWVMADAQIDDLQRGLFRPDFDLMDVPRDRFVVAGDAWAQCRAGAADPARFGIMDMRGLWFVAGNLVRDAAALNGMEMLPWDVWGGMFGPDRTPDEAQLAFLDHLAALTRDPDAHFAELRALYATDDRLRVPPVVHNAVFRRDESVLA